MISEFFHQKVVVLTGASSGIGADLARQLAPLKTRLVLVSRSEEKLASLRNELSGKGSEILICPTDIQDFSQVKNLISQTEKKFGTIDILINNAGVGQFGPLVSLAPAKPDASAQVGGRIPILHPEPPIGATSPQNAEKLQTEYVNQIRAVMETNYWGAVYACLAAIPIMKAKGHGSIVNITSTAGFHGFPDIAVYSSSKAALHTLSEALRIELSPFGIRVVEIQPGVIDNEFHINALGPSKHLYRNKQIRGGDPKKLTQKILKAIVAGKREVVFPRYWWFYKILNRLFPGMMEWIFIRTQVPKLK